MSLKKFIAQAEKENYKKGLLYEQLFGGHCDPAFIINALNTLPFLDRLEVLKTIKSGIQWEEKVRKADGTIATVKKHLNVPRNTELTSSLPDYEGDSGKLADQAYNGPQVRSNVEAFRKNLNEKGDEPNEDQDNK